MTVDRSVQIIDAHHHLWELRRFPYLWLKPEAGPRAFGDHSAIKRDYLASEHAFNLSVDLIGSVHVQANAGAPDPVDETAWVEEETRSFSWPVAIVGEIRLSDEDPAEAIARHSRTAAFRGFRVFAGYDDDPKWRQCTDPEFLRSAKLQVLAEALARRRLSLDVVLHAQQLPAVAELAAAFPDLPIVINHLAQPRKSDLKAAAEWREGILRASDEPNLYIKISGLWTIDRDWRPEVIAPFLAHVVQAFGAARCMYGSNLPIEMVMMPPDLQVPRLLAGLGPIAKEARDAIFRRTAAGFYRL